MSGVAGIAKIPELRKRILFSLIILMVYRLGVHVPVPGINSQALETFFKNLQGTVFTMFNMISGGALERFSIMALGVAPYISASIIMQLLTVVWPYLHDLQKEGEQGRKKITQYTRYGAVVLALIQGWGASTALEAAGVALVPGLAFRLMTTVTVTTGTIFLMWLGEQISERGIGNGISLLIFAGIAARLPNQIGTIMNLNRTGELSFFKILVLLAVGLATFFVIIFVERAARRIPVQYAKRVVGRKIYGGQTTHLPLKVNSSGVIPPIFASSLIAFPSTLGVLFPNAPMFRQISALFAHGEILYQATFVGLIIFFCYFYTAVTFKTDDVAENLKKHGGFIPGIRPGPSTAEYIDYVLGRITLGGAIYISAICIMPDILSSKVTAQIVFGGTSVLILVGVALDTAAQIETFLLSRNYEGFMKHARIRGRSAYS